MGAILAQTILHRAQTTLLEDGAGTYWLRTDLFDMLNEAVQAICAGRPDQYTINGAIALQEGVKQLLPENATVLEGITRNMGANGVLPGRAIRQTDLDSMTRARADWTIDTPEEDVENFMYDKRDPKVFYVWPPQPYPANFVEMVYAASSPVLTAETQAIPIDDTFETPIYNWIMSRAYEKNATRGDLVKSNYYKALVKSDLGIEVGARQAVLAEAEKA